MFTPRHLFEFVTPVTVRDSDDPPPPLRHFVQVLSVQSLPEGCLSQSKDGRCSVCRFGVETAKMFFFFFCNAFGRMDIWAVLSDEQMSYG